MSRIGVFVCQCGNNIKDTVDCQKVADEAKNIPGVVHAENCGFRQRRVPHSTWKLAAELLRHAKHITLGVLDILAEEGDAGVVSQMVT